MSDTEEIGTLRPGGDPPGNLDPIFFSSLQSGISLPINWVVTREFDRDSRYGDIHVVTARGPADSVSGVGYSTIRWFAAPAASRGGVLSNLAEFEQALTQDYFDRDGSVSTAVQVQVGGKAANQLTFEGSKLVPLNAINRQSVPTRLTSTRLEANGYFHDFSLSGTQPDHDKYLPLYNSVLASVRFSP